MLYNFAIHSLRVYKVNVPKVATATFKVRHCNSCMTYRKEVSQPRAIDERLTQSGL